MSWHVCHVLPSLVGKESYVDVLSLPMLSFTCTIMIGCHQLGWRYTVQADRVYAHSNMLEGNVARKSSGGLNPGQQVVTHGTFF